MAYDPKITTGKPIVRRAKSCALYQASVVSRDFFALAKAVTTCAKIRPLSGIIAFFVVAQNLTTGRFEHLLDSDFLRKADNGNSDNYYFTWGKSNVTSDQTVYVKAYLIYKDADGVEHTIYGDLVTATLTE
jgi:hypothetical protein